MPSPRQGQPTPPSKSGPWEGGRGPWTTDNYLLQVGGKVISFAVVSEFCSYQIAQILFRDFRIWLRLLGIFGTGGSELENGLYNISFSIP